MKKFEPKLTPVEQLGLEISATVKRWPPAMRRAWEAAYRAERNKALRKYFPGG